MCVLVCVLMLVSVPGGDGSLEFNVDSALGRVFAPARPRPVPGTEAKVG